MKKHKKSKKTSEAADKPAKESGPPFTNYWRILSFGTKRHHAILIVATCAAATSGVALPLMNIVFGNLVTDFSGYFIPNSGVTEQRFKASVSRNALYFVYLFIGKFALTYIAMLSYRISGLRISASLRLNYLQALFAQPLTRLDQVSTGAVANTITSSANTIQLSVSDRLSNLFQSSALIISAIVIAFRYSWQLTLATSSGLVFVVLVYSLTTPLFLKTIKAMEAADVKHATIASETVSSIRTVFALGAEEKMSEKHAKHADESYHAAKSQARWFGLQVSPMYFAIYASYALAFWLGLKLYREGYIKNVGTVIIVFFSVLLITGVMGQLFQPLMYIQQAVGASGAFFEMIDSEKVDRSGLKSPLLLTNHDIELKDVNFVYPTRQNVQVLDGLSITFEKNKTTALVGPSGCGKSTIVALLERWYELESQSSSLSEPTVNMDSGDEKDTEKRILTANTGAVTLGGHNINTFDLKWWRTSIGLVLQEPFLFNDTIEQNIAYGLIGTQWENAEDSVKKQLIEEACKEAFADEFIEKLPGKYTTRVGEGGIKLSGGQRQRLAIARSIVRKPSILILDEATSAIDVRGEQIVQKALDRAAMGRTTIVIAHRLSTIRKADKIVVLRNGKKIEEGTHEQLLDREGLYFGLVQAQNIQNQQGSDIENEQASETDFIAPQLARTHTYASTITGNNETGPSVDVEKYLPSTSYRTKGFFGTVGVFLLEQKSIRLYMAATLLALAGCGGAYALQSWFFAQLVQAFTFTGQRLIEAANFWALMFFVLALSIFVLYFVAGYGSGVISAETGHYCRSQYFRGVLQLPITWFDTDDNSSGSVMSRVSGDPKQVQDMLGPIGLFPIVAIFNVVGCTILAFYFGWKLTLVVFFAVMPVILGAAFIRLRLDMIFEKTNAEVFSSSSQFATEAVSAYRTVSSLAMEETIVQKYSNLLETQVNDFIRKSWYTGIVYALGDSLELLGMALTFWYGGQLLASFEYQPVQFFVIFAAIVQGAQQAGLFLSLTPNLAKATAAGNRILELRGRSMTDQASPNPRPLEALNKSEQEIINENGGREDSNPENSMAGVGGAARVEFHKVNFTYPSSTTPLFSQLNLTIEAGQFAAFVGPSGCGKTTTISLLERFYDPNSGSIVVDRKNIDGMNVRTYRKGLALVSQEPKLFSGTIKQNLLLGVDENAVTDEQVEQACRDAEIHDFIVSLPDGYATDMGQSSSTTLSGGQKQRVCLARALLRKPKLLLLDEATSSLDSQSEKLVQGAIERLAGQRNMTVIAVAHRLATIQKADIIFVFGERDTEGKRGSRIVEKGSHSELLSKRGVYWSMCQAQALDK